MRGVLTKNYARKRWYSLRAYPRAAQSATRTSPRRCAGEGRFSLPAMTGVTRMPLDIATIEFQRCFGNPTDTVRVQDAQLTGTATGLRIWPLEQQHMSPKPSPC